MCTHTAAFPQTAAFLWTGTQSSRICGNCWADAAFGSCCSCMQFPAVKVLALLRTPLLLQVMPTQLPRQAIPMSQTTLLKAHFRLWVKQAQPCNCAIPNIYILFHWSVWYPPIPFLLYGGSTTASNPGFATNEFPNNAWPHWEAHYSILIWCGQVVTSEYITMVVVFMRDQWCMYVYMFRSPDRQVWWPLCTTDKWLSVANTSYNLTEKHITANVCMYTSVPLEMNSCITCTGRVWTTI